MNDYLSLKQLGQIYGVSSHLVGKWLKGLGLRTTSGGPSAQAFSEGFVQRSPSTQPGTYFFVWHRVKTVSILDAMRYQRAIHNSDEWELGSGDS